MKKAMLGTLLAMAAMGAQAATQPASESSAVVNGTIVLAKDGTVQTAVIDDPAKYGQPIANFVQKAALQWHFQPVLHDGQPVVAKASMHARVVLTQKPDGNYNARIKGVTFGDDDPNDTSTLHETARDKNLRPGYPAAAAIAHVQATVYVSLRVDRSGHVVDAAAEQVNLLTDGLGGADGMLDHYRQLMARAALTGARKMTFVVPTTGKLAKKDSWIVRVPFMFLLNANPSAWPVWSTYVPGPYSPAPWVVKPDADAVDAIADDGLQVDDSGPTLAPASSGHG